MRRLYQLLATVLVALIAVTIVSAQEGEASDTEVVHTVQPYETLNYIALFYDVTVQAIAERNDIANPNLIYFGDQLIIPLEMAPDPIDPVDTTRYVVQDGESLGLLALCFDTSISEIARLNTITNPNIVFFGEVLQVPGQYICGSPLVGNALPPVDPPAASD